MSNPAIQLFCINSHPMGRGADWCSTCGEPPAKTDRGQDSAGRTIAVGNTVSWRGAIYTIKAFGGPNGRCSSRTIEFEETLHTNEVPDEIAVDLVEES